MNARETLLSFLYELNPDIVYVEDTVEELVEANFDTLDEKNMRLLIDAALKERDINLKKGGNENELLGSWGVVIDLIKTTTLKRRNRAGDMLQLVVNTGVKSGPKELQTLLATLKAEKKIDRVFTDLVATSLEDCQSQGNVVLADILKYAKTFLGVLASKDKLSKPAGTAPPPPPSPPAPPSTEKAFPPTIAPSSVQSAAAIAEAELEGEKVRAGALLREMLQTSAGDVTALRTNAIERCLTGEIDTPFLAVLEDNIKGCRDANYVNKLKVLEFLRTAVSAQLDQQKLGTTSNSSYAGNSSGGSSNSSDGQSTTTHHAPQFVDDVAASSSGRGSKRSFADAGHVEVTLLPEVEGHFINAVEASAALRGAPASAAHPGKVNNKKKAAKSSAKRLVARMAAAAAAHLEEHGWAVLDNFLPEELVQRVRVESGLFRSSYEQSEIWVGKQADVGAQLSVPSVRGDKVLWMCGGHSSAAPEGVSRTVRTIGEIEPCKLEVKAQAPIRRFGAMKELVGSADALMEAMKTHSPSLARVYERSDAMLAVYPGEGARFAKHIDNTTGDGRKLTLLAYLNPRWKKEDGGALRLFPKPRHSTDSSPDQQHQAVDVYPIGGRVAMFYSADVAHEVLPTFGDRHAITLWYYDQAERTDAVKRAREEGSAKKVATASVASQQTAKVFISELMGGDEVSEDGGEPSESELAALTQKVTQLSDEVIGVVAAITGAPSVQSFRTGFPMLSTQDLKSMRALFRRMGLGSYAVASD